MLRPRARAAALGGLLVLCAACGEPASVDGEAAHGKAPPAETPAPPAPGSAAEARPDVLLITVDTLRADHLSSYGFPLETSPEIDALAREGVLFERAIAAAAATTPSHASILTSRYTRQHSIGFDNGGTKLVGARTVAEAFREAGYATAGFVGNVVLQRRTGFARGFDLYDDELPSRERNRPALSERTADATAAAATAWLESAGSKQVFLWVHLQDPHGPYTPPPIDEGRFSVPRESGEAPLPLLSGNSGRNGIPRYQHIEGYTLPSQYRSRYADEIFHADRAIGELVRIVDARAGDRGAIVLLTADHGESFGENERWFVHFHTTTPENSHVPFVLRAPGLAPERRADVVHHVDIMPTLLELAGVERPPRLSGLPLGPFLRDGRALPDRYVYCDNGREISAYREEGFHRLKGTGRAWSEEGAEHRLPYGRASHYAWPRDAGFAVAEEDADVPGAVTAYARRAMRMRKARSMSEANVEALRALGYVEPAAGSE